jgi:hypothetical protein
VFFRHDMVDLMAGEGSTLGDAVLAAAFGTVADQTPELG